MDTLRNSGFTSSKPLLRSRYRDSGDWGPPDTFIENFSDTKLYFQRQSQKMDFKYKLLQQIRDNSERRSQSKIRGKENELMEDQRIRLEQEELNKKYLRERLLDRPIKSDSNQNSPNKEVPNKKPIGKEEQVVEEPRKRFEDSHPGLSNFAKIDEDQGRYSKNVSSRLEKKLDFGAEEAGKDSLDKLANQMKSSPRKSDMNFNLDREILKLRISTQIKDSQKKNNPMGQQRMDCFLVKDFSVQDTLDHILKHNEKIPVLNHFGFESTIEEDRL